MQLISIKANLQRLKRLYLWLALSFIIYIAWTHSADFVAASEHISAFSVPQLALCLSIAVFSYTCRSLRWFGYMRLNESRISIMCHTIIYLSGFAFTASPGKVGELMRGTHLSEVGVPFRYTFLAFVSERLLDVLVVLFLGTYFLVAYFNPAFGLLSATLLCLPFIAVPVLKLTLNVIRHNAWLESVNILIALWGSRVVPPSLVLTLLAWSAQGIILFTVLQGFGVEANAGMVISIYCLSLLIGAASLVPSGIGVTEVGMVWLLTQVGVEVDIAIIASLITRMLTLWPAMLVGLCCALILKNTEVKQLQRQTSAL